MMHNSFDCVKKTFFLCFVFLAGTNNLFMYRDTGVPHAVMYHLRDAVA